jgi:hypothetical protein
MGIKKYLLKIVLSYYPFIISLLLFLVLVAIQPFKLQKYRISRENTLNTGNHSFYTYSDLDNDDHSEKIRFIYLEDKNLTGIAVYKNNRIVNQWNYDGAVNLRNIDFIIGDYDHNEYKEITIFTYRKDSIYLNMIEPFPDKMLRINNKRLNRYTRVLMETKSHHFTIHKGGFTNFDGHPDDELYFSITAGYPKQPRRVCIYNIVKDTLLLSPEAGIQIRNLHCLDLNNDGAPELTGDAYAYGNHLEKFPYTDQKGWFMVFNRNMDFVFEPLSFDEFPMKLYVEPFKRGKETLLFVYHCYYGIKDISPKLYIYNSQGKVIREKVIKLPKEPRKSCILSRHNELYFITGKGRVQLLDTSLRVQKQWFLKGIFNGKVQFKGDINGDKKNEFIFKGQKDNEFIVTQNDLKHPTSVTIPHENNAFHFAIKKDGKGNHSLFVHTKEITATYNYEKTLLYTFRYPFYTGIFGVIWLFVWSLNRLQSWFINQKLKTRQKISELQLKSVKNQIEPHFTFNLLNSISSLLYKEDIGKANYLTEKYADLLRHSLVYSDKILIPLADEIKYIEHYLEIEKHRYSGRFDYNIHLKHNVHLNVNIPKMLVFTFVENAVKHGVRYLENNGYIGLQLSKGNGHYVIEILDNGIGFDRAAQLNSGSFKKGLSTVNKIVNYYKEIDKRKIHYEIKDLYNDEDDFPGTHVKIYVPYGIKG